jgi:peptidylprolyl isomerase
MKVGGRRELIIPPSEAYGSTAYGTIPANSTLVFVIDLLKVSK